MPYSAGVAASATVCVIVVQVLAHSAAICLPHGAGANSAGTNLATSAHIAARPTVVGIDLSVGADTATKIRIGPGRVTYARSGQASFPGAADHSTCAAVAHIGLLVGADAATKIRIGPGRIAHTRSGLACPPGAADDSTCAAVVGVGLLVGADTATKIRIGPGRITHARSSRAILASATGDSACAAVGFVHEQVHTRTAASFQGRAARSKPLPHANAVAALPALRAHRAAVSTIGNICQKFCADAGADIQVVLASGRGLIDTSAILASLPGRAFLPTNAAVGLVGIQVNTRSTAVYLGEAVAPL